MSLGFYALGEQPLSFEPFQIKANANSPPIFLANRGYTTRGSDAPANQHFPGLLTLTPNIERSLIQSSQLLDGQAIRIFGDLEFDNSEGLFDETVDAFAVDGRRVVLKVGVVTENADGTLNQPAYSDFGSIFDGTGESWSFDENTVRLKIRGNEALLEQPILGERYKGTGGLEGDADLEGVPKPLVFGFVENVRPVLLDEFDLIYQVSRRQIKGFIDRDGSKNAVFDKGVPLNFGRDFPSFGGLASANTAANHFDTCKNEGMFKLGSPPTEVGAVNCTNCTDHRREQPHCRRGQTSLAPKLRRPFGGGDFLRSG